MAGKTGYEIRRIGTPMRSLSYGLNDLSRRIQVNGVIDIGVADGTPELYGAFPASRHAYLLVEADPHYEKNVRDLAAAFDGAYELAFAGAIHSKAVFNVYADHRKSSLFINKKQGRADHTIDVAVAPLDSMVASHRIPPPYVVKIDAEGAERDVIQGAHETLAQAKAVVLEASVAKKFDGAPEFADLVAAMHARGFSVFDILAGSNRNGTLYQVDLVFVRTDDPLRLE